MDADERKEFVAGLRKYTGQLRKKQPTREQAREFVEFFESWVLSVKLARDATWREQVAESQRLWEQGTSEDDYIPADVPLRDALTD
jgi:hypothetical protein